MSEPVKLKLSKYRIVLGDEDDPGSWRELTVTVRPTDNEVAMDLIARHKEWPSASDNPYRLMLASVFYALKRRGEYEGSFDTFRADVLDCSAEEAEEVTPTEPAPSAG